MDQKDNTKHGKALRCAAYCMVGLCVAIQLLIQFFMNSTPQISDCGEHVRLATESVENGTLYPAAINTYDNYLLAPVLINFLLLQLKVFGTLQYNWVFNLVFNLVITYCIYLIGKKCFSEKTALWSVIGWSSLYSVWTGVYPISTEVLFLALAISALTLCLEGGLAQYILAGILIGLANGVRPLVIIYIPTIIIVMILGHRKFRDYAALFLSALLTVSAIGMYVMKTTGHFRYSSTTEGLNMVIQARDGADGSLPHNFDELELYKGLDGMDYVQKDNELKEMAFGWIKEHPGQFFILYLKKIPIMYFHDTSFDGYYYHTRGYGEVTHNEYLRIFAVKALKSLTYYVILVMFVVSLFKRRKYIFSLQGAFLLIPLLGTLGTCLFQTMARYHYPLLPFIVLWAMSLIAGKNTLSLSEKRETKL